MPQPPSPRRRRRPPPKRVWLDTPTALLLLAGGLVFAAFQVSFALAVVVGLATGAIVWMSVRRRVGGRSRARPVARRR